jgi:hypothetical protein
MCQEIDFDRVGDLLLNFALMGYYTIDYIHFTNPSAKVFCE